MQNFYRREAVDDRRHTSITHIIATAMSIRDFRDQVTARRGSDVSVPSIEWLRLQFWPKTAHTKRALHHTGRFQVRFKVQQRQFRKDHPDSHYAAAVFRYLREYAVMLRDHCMFVCLDDKHRIKVGEPVLGYLVAATERGRQVLTAAGLEFQVGDHDFPKFSIMALQLGIPDDISGSWYSGLVNALFKEGAFEPSNPTRHMTELASIIETESHSKAILFLYTDGPPAHLS